jgi:hypothetical protein
MVTSVRQASLLVPKAIAAPPGENARIVRIRTRVILRRSANLQSAWEKSSVSALNTDVKYSSCLDSDIPVSRLPLVNLLSTSGVEASLSLQTRVSNAFDREACKTIARYIACIRFGIETGSERLLGSVISIQ